MEDNILRLDRHISILKKYVIKNYWYVLKDKQLWEIKIHLKYLV